MNYCSLWMHALFEESKAVYQTIPWSQKRQKMGLVCSRRTNAVSPYTGRRFVVGNRSRGSIKRNVSKSVQKSDEEPNKDGLKPPGDKECSLCFKRIKSVDKTYLIPCYHMFHKKCLCEKIANEAAKGCESLCTKCLIMAMTGEKRQPVDLTKLDPAAHYIYTKNGRWSLLLDSSEGSSDGDSTPETVSP